MFMLTLTPLRYEKPKIDEQEHSEVQIVIEHHQVAIDRLCYSYPSRKHLDVPTSDPPQHQ
jgi:uncharacterized protein YsxB (DUF464 family)